MNTEERLNEIEKKIESNYNEITTNINRLHKHEEKINKNSGAIEVLHAIKTYNNRFFWMWIITFFAFLVSFGYTIYLLNDISNVETTTQEVQQENESGLNNYIGNDGDIIYGKANN